MEIKLGEQGSKDRRGRIVKMGHNRWTRETFRVGVLEGMTWNCRKWWLERCA